MNLEELELPRCGESAARRAGRRRLVGWRRWWDRLAWPALAVGALVVAALGYVGIAAQEPSLGPADWAYGSFQLFWINGGMDSAGAGWPLHVARFLAPLFTLGAIMRSLASAFRQGRDQILGRFFLRDHIIVCGCGDVGYRIASAAAKDGRSVIVVELSKQGNNLSALQRRSVPIIFGNASSRATLEAAGLKRASRVVVVTDSDDVNLAVTRMVLDHPQTSAFCVTHVRNLAVWPIACERYRASDRVRLVNAHEQVALSMLGAVPGGLDLTEGSHRFVVVGRGGHVEALAVHLAKRWQIERESPEEPLDLVIASDDSFDWAEHIVRAYPGIERMVRLDSIPLEPGAATSAWARTLAGCGETRAVLVATPDAAEATSLAISVAHMRRCAEGVEGCRVVALSGADADALAGDSLPNLAFADWGAGFANIGALLDGSSEEMARLAHERYGRVERARAAEVGEQPTATARRAWEELPEYVKGRPQELDHALNQNRGQAAATATYLRAIGCTTTSLLDWDPEPFCFDDAGETPESNEVLRLAIVEHRRWWRCMESMGFVPDPGRAEREEWATDYERRSTPFYVDYWKLPEKNQEMDQAAIRNIPIKLALVGLRPMRSSR